jgi:tagatose-1,6-bisphosphate aldolase
MTTSLSIGKRRHLHQISTPDGGLAVLALDHRGGLRKLLNPEAPQSVPDSAITALKFDIVRHLAPHASAVLLDPEYSAAQTIASDVMPGSTGLVVAVEATGYEGDAKARTSQVLPGWSVAKAKRMGASAVKLLVYYHPDAPTARGIESLVVEVAEACAQHELPLMVEPLTYTLNPEASKLTPDERPQVIIETARRLTVPGVDILKAEFPVDWVAEPDEKVWERVCAEMTAASAVPWILLSASVEFEVFVQQVTACCRAGASGVAVGRAVWKEAGTLDVAARREFLLGEGIQRMRRITGLVDALAKPWARHFTADEVTSTWYKTY